MPQALLFKMALQLDFQFAERPYLSNVFGKGIVSPSAVYSEAPLAYNVPWRHLWTKTHLR